jgi:hypothetical protein
MFQDTPEGQTHSCTHTTDGSLCDVCCPLTLCPSCNTMKHFSGERCARCKGKEIDWLGPYIRDLTTVHPKSKSEVRRMLEEIVAEAQRLERERIRGMIEGMRRMKKPTHGICCTCQECGYSNDDTCECPRNEHINEILSKLSNE